jgi:hypothetical protein
MSSPDSRIEVTPARPAPLAKGRSLGRWLLPVGVGVLLVGGALLLQSHAIAPAVIASGDAQAPSAPATAAAAPFRLDIASQPSGASVSEGSVRLGTTPFSLTMSVPEGGLPRVLVVEKEGYEPYVVRQGAARGEVRVMAALQARAPEAPAAPSAVPTPPIKPTAEPVRARPAAAKRPAAIVPDKPPSDIRLER